MQWINDISVAGKRVLVRADFNVPVNERGDIMDDFRIQATVPTLRHILDKGGKLVVMSHLGDPEGRKEDRLAMDRVKEKLMECLKVPVAKADDCAGNAIEQRTRDMREGEVLLLENLRFRKEEEENDKGFAKELAAMGDMYVSDAFGVLHRTHASVVGVPRFLPAAGGLLLKKEIQGLQKLLENPKHPMVAIIGGRKIESKLPVIDRIAELADEVLLGNLLSNEITAKNIVFKRKEKVILPVDSFPGDGEDYDI
ncbi:MAG: phosphoglycerate kinase, partial [bacterium]|nr:phosphoglycerate kinase [bacterium]